MMTDQRPAALMARQWGLITRTQCFELGLDRHVVDRLIRTRQWRVVRRGVYAEAAHLAALTTHTQARLLADRAGSLRITEPHVLSHHSAAHLLGLEVLREKPPRTHVGRPGIVGAHVRHGVTHHLAPYAASQVVVVDGVAALDPARTAVDIARHHGYRQGLVATDSALRRGTTLAELHRAAAPMTHWPGIAVVRAVLAACSPDTDSLAETLGRDLVVGLGFGVPQVQFGLTAEGRTVWCDLRLGRHIFEIDGAVKYRPHARGGLAGVPEDELWDEKLRQDFVTGFKLGASRLTWHDFFGPQRAIAEERCRREFLDTCARFGTSIDDLHQFRPRGPRPRQPVLPALLPTPMWVG